MNKSVKKGFVLIETLIVSTLILSTLVFLYLQFKSVRNKYEYSFKYDTVTGVYMANEISKFLEDSNYDNLINLLVDDTSYIDITSSSTVNGNSATYISLISDMHVNRIIFTKDKISYLQNHLNSGEYDTTIFNPSFKEYISKIKTDNTDGYRIIIQFDDKTYATTLLGESNPNPVVPTPEPEPEEPITGPAPKINSCPGCVYMYPLEGTYSLSAGNDIDGEYSEDYRDIIRSSKKNYFAGAILNQTEIEETYLCGILNKDESDEAAFCVRVMQYENHEDECEEVYDSNKSLLSEIYGPYNSSTKKGCEDDDGWFYCYGTINTSISNSCDGRISDSTNDKDECLVDYQGGVYCEEKE